MPFSQSYEEILEDMQHFEKIVLKATTPKGSIIIEKFAKVIVATDNDNKEIARTYNVSENGLRWIKNECRGWHGWGFRLNWAATTIDKHNH